MRNRLMFSVGVGLIALLPALAQAGGGAPAGHGATFPSMFLFLVVMLLCARIGALVERYRQPAVLGELLMGIALSTLAFVPALGGIAAFRHDAFIGGIAEIGVILLLFRVGLESNIGEMRKVGVRAGLVAVVGVVLPFVGGWLMSRLLLPGMGVGAHVFIGATLTATSVGITARVFKDLSHLQSTEARIVLGAAVIDDVLGLLILAVVSGAASGGAPHAWGIALLTGKAFAFLLGSIVLGQLAAPHVAKILARIHPGVGMKMAMALLFCGAFAYGAHEFAGLAPVIGAFAAGLVLDPLHFAPFAVPHISARMRDWATRTASDHAVSGELRDAADHEDRQHVEALTEGVANFFVPIFFVYTGLQVNLTAFLDLGTVGIALAITGVAFVGKLASGFAAGRGADWMLVGVGMIPRGEVGLIFANIGRAAGILDDRTFAIVLIVVVLTTLLPSLLLAPLVRRSRARAKA